MFLLRNKPRIIKVEVGEESAILQIGAAAQERLRSSGGVSRSRRLDLDDLSA